MQGEIWVHALFVILVALSGDQKLANVQSTATQLDSAAPLNWLVTNIQGYDSCNAMVIRTDPSMLRLRRATTDDVIVVQIAGRPFFLASSDNAMMHFTGISSELSLRDSEFVVGWDQSALIASNRPIQPDDQLSSWSLTSIVVVFGAIFAAVFLFALVIRRFRST